MKDMSLEELIDESFDLVILDEHPEYKAELLRRFESLEKELQATKLAHAVEKQLMTDNFTQCKTAAEYLKTENNNLRCCGNCKHSYSHCYGSLMCKKLDQSTGRGGYCSNWTTDGLTRAEREK